MITIIYSTHKDAQILEYINHNEHSLSELYNKGISESIYNIVVCCHKKLGVKIIK